LDVVNRDEVLQFTLMTLPTKRTHGNAGRHRGIHADTAAAFNDALQSSHTEQYIVDALRERGELVVSKVAVHGEHVIGHVAVSPVAISDGSAGWFGLGPISVDPPHQGQGVGASLMQAALAPMPRGEVSYSPAFEAGPPR